MSAGEAVTEAANFTRLCKRGGVIDRPKREPRLRCGDTDEDCTRGCNFGNDGERQHAVDWGSDESGCTISEGGWGGRRNVEYAAPPGSHIVFVSGPWEKRPQFP